MLIILMAIFLIFIIQITYVVIGTFWVNLNKDKSVERDIQATNFNVIETRWHEEARVLTDISNEIINQHFEKWKGQYPEATMFWVDERGFLAEEIDVKEGLPSQWTSTFTAKFIKERYNADPFTVIAFVGKDEMKGFIVFEIPRATFDPPLQKLYTHYGTILSIAMLFIIVVFITISFLFFQGIKKRLLQLQDAMEIRDVDGLPIQIEVKKKDEVGQLEQTFNQMVDELRESKKREQKEEQLRKKLIANLSHDLRTPLTKISAQTYSIKKENVTEDIKQAIKTLETSIQDMDRLIENLMSYTLLMASKYKYNPQEIDVIRFVRESLASWYPVFEKEGFQIEIELQSFKEKIWVVDPVWLGRILDNLFQNVLRHGKCGRSITVRTESTNQYDVIVIMDRGKGMNNGSHEKGAGIGLSIVDMMVKGMKLDWEIDSSGHGTAIKIKKYKSNASFLNKI